MSDLRIVDAPEIPTEEITGSEKLPTGGNGNYSISLDSLASHTKTSLDLANKTDVQTSSNGVKAQLDQHKSDLNNPHQVTKGQIGLGNVDNTADADKPMSNAVQSAITTLTNNKADKTSVYLKTETYNKTEIDSALETKPNSTTVYTKTEVNNLLNGKVTSVNGKTGTAITLNRSDLGISSDIVMQQWEKEARYVVDESGLNQSDINSGMKYLDDLNSVPIKVEGDTLYVLEKDSNYSYSLTPNPVSFYGWNLNHDGWYSLNQLNIENKSDISDIMQYTIDNDFRLEIPENMFVSSNVFSQFHVFGKGHLKYNKSGQTADNIDNITPKTLAPYPQKNEKNYGWYDSVEARSNFEQGQGWGLMVNTPELRPQVCGYTTKQWMKTYGSTDLVGLYVHMKAQKHSTISNCSFTSTSVTSVDIIDGINCKVGDFLRTSFDNTIGKTWRAIVERIDYATNTIYVPFWIHEAGGGEGVPPSGLSFRTPDSNAIWGQNTNVLLTDNSPAVKTIGYELGIGVEGNKTPESMGGFYVVNLSNGGQVANYAYSSSGKFSAFCLTYDARMGYSHRAQLETDVSFDVDNYIDNPSTMIRSRYKNNPIFTMNTHGRMSAFRLQHRVVSASVAHTHLQGSIIIGANATAAYTVTIGTSSMPIGHVIEITQTDAVDMTVIAANQTYVLNTAGSKTYLKIMWDGNFFQKIFCGKSQ